MTKNNRDEFPPRVREAVAKRVAYRCSRPDCPNSTIGPHTDPTKALVVGIAAHIIAAARGGPRASADISSTERRSIENAIWLCTRCATLIDKDESPYSVDELRNWKAAAEEKARRGIHWVTADPRDVLRDPQAFPPHHDIFHPHILRQTFTGRSEQRQSLTDWWKAGPPVRVIVGMGGQGKSSLAWVWMQEDVLGKKVVGNNNEPNQQQHITGFRGSKRPKGVLWWSFYAPELKTNQAFEHFVIRALSYVTHGKVQPTQIPSLNDRIDHLLNYLRRGRFLLILDGFERLTKLYDNLATPNEADSSESEAVPELRKCVDEQVGRFLREVSADSLSRVLITSRVYPDDVGQVESVERYNLDGLTADESLALFRAYRVRGSDQEVLDACKAVGYHPLAVRLMIGHVHAPGPYRGHIRALPDLSLHLNEHDRRRHIFEVAYKHLSATDKVFFGRVAVYTQAISYPVLKNVSPHNSTQRLNRGIERLEQRGFLEHDPMQETYDMHPLVRQYAYAQMATPELREAARVAYQYLEDRLAKHEGTLATYSVSMKVYRLALEAGFVGSAVQIFRHRLYPVLYSRIGQCREQVDELERLIAAAQEHPDQVTKGNLRGLMDRLGTAYVLLGRPREAYRWAKMAEMLHNSVPGAADEESVLVYLASAAMRMGKFQFATDALQKSAQINREKGARFRESVARLNLGLGLTWSARFEEAAAELDTADELIGDTPTSWHRRCILLVHRTRLALLIGSGERALKYARAAHKIAIEKINDLDLVRSRWALGAALVRCVEEDPSLRALYLSEAELHIRSTLRTCSQNHYGEIAMELHIAMAHWHYVKGDPAQAGVAAGSAFALARTGGHAVKEAEAKEILLSLTNQSGTNHDLAQAGTAGQFARSSEHVAVWALTALPCFRPLHLEAPGTVWCSS